MMKTYRVTVAVAALMALSGCGIFKGGVKKTPTVGDRVSILVSENEVEADKTIADRSGVTPLRHAEGRGYREMISILR